MVEFVKMQSCVVQYTVKEKIEPCMQFPFVWYSFHSLIEKIKLYDTLLIIVRQYLLQTITINLHFNLKNQLFFSTI